MSLRSIQAPSVAGSSLRSRKPVPPSQVFVCLCCGQRVLPSKCQQLHYWIAEFCCGDCQESWWGCALCCHHSHKESRFSRGVVSTIVILGPQQHDGSRKTHLFVVERCQRTDQQPVNFQLYRLRKDLDKKTTKLSMRYYQWNVEASPTNFGDLLAVFPNPQFQGTFG